MKEWKDTFSFSFPWETVVQAAYRKYPTKHNTNVLSLDVLERNVRKRYLYSHRLFSTLWSAPSIALKILGVNPVLYIHEKSECDLESRMLTITAVNVTLRNFFKMTEVLQYAQDPHDPSKTLLRQSATMSVYGVPLLGDLLESILISSYEPTVSKGRIAMIEKSEVITSESKN